jgi:hypothetical protein
MNVRHQLHYTKFKIQPAKFIIENGMSYAQGCAIKYLTRFQDKGTPVKDLEKAKHYIDMLIEMEKKGSIHL